jgi:hypothetical protein
MPLSTQFLDCSQASRNRVIFRVILAFSDSAVHRSGRPTSLAETAVRRAIFMVEKLLVLSF